MRRILFSLLLAFVVTNVLAVRLSSQRPLAESTQNIPIGSCFTETNQCWDGARWVPKAKPFETKSWPLSDKLPVYVIETAGVCLYVINYTGSGDAHSALWGISKKDLPVGAGCQ